MRRIFCLIGYIFGAYCIISNIIGIAGIPEDVVTWKKWINVIYNLSMTTSINQNIIQVIFLIVGLFVLYICSSTHRKIYSFLKHKSRLQIDFDLKKYPSCLDDTSNTYKDPKTGKTICVVFTQKWRIAIYNSSSVTIKNVEVVLAEIDNCLPEQRSKLPKHLKQMDDKEPYRRSFEINPKSHKYFDVVECFMESTPINRNHFIIQHIGNVYPYLMFDIDKNDFKITIEVTGENITCKPRNFTIGLRDDVIKMW